MNSDQTAKGEVWFGSILFAMMAIEVCKQTREQMTIIVVNDGKTALLTVM